MRQRTITLSPGEATPVSARANYIKIISALYSVQVESVSTENNIKKDSVSVILSQGRGIKLDETHDRWMLTNTGALAQNVTIVFGRGKIEDDSIIGDVNALTQIYKKTDDGNQFNAFILTAASTLFNYVQLWNPAGSGKQIYVSRVDASQDGTNEIRMGISSTELSGLLSSASSRLQNKKSGGSSPSAVILAEDGIGLLNSSDVMFRAKIGCNANGIGSKIYSSNIFKSDNGEGLIIGEGYGLTIETVASSVVAQANIEFEEYA